MQITAWRRKNQTCKEPVYHLIECSSRVGSSNMEEYESEGFYVGVSSSPVTNDFNKVKTFDFQAELFVCLREDLQKLSKAVQDFVTQVNSNHNVFDNPSDDEYDLDLCDYKEDEEFFSEQSTDPSYGVFEDEADVSSDRYSFDNQLGDAIFDVYDEDDVKDNDASFDVHSFVPNYEKFDEDAMKQVTLAKVEDESVSFSESIYARETPTLSHEDFATSDGVKNNFDLKDTTHLLQTMSETSGWSHNYFEIISLSTKEDCFEEQKPEHVLIFDVEEKQTYVDAMNQQVRYDVWRKDCHRQIIRQPPDRDLRMHMSHRVKKFQCDVIYSDQVLHNTVDKDPSYEEENKRLNEDAEDVKSLLFTRWHVSNEPPDPGRSESLFNHVWSYSFSAYEGNSFNKFIALPLEDIITHSSNMCSKITRASDFVSSIDIEKHTKKIEQNVLYLTTSGNKFGNIALSFFWASEHELWNVRIVNSTKLFSNSNKARDENFCEAKKRKGSVFCEELYGAPRQLNLWNKSYSHGLMCGLSTEWTINLDFRSRNWGLELSEHFVSLSPQFTWSSLSARIRETNHDFPANHSAFCNPHAILSLHVSILEIFDFGFTSQRVNTVHYPAVFYGFDGLVLFGFCSVWVPLVTDLKVIQFMWMLDPAAQISMIWCAYTVFISNSLVCNDYQCTWLEHKKCKGVYTSATNLMWGLKYLSFKVLHDQTSLCFEMGCGCISLLLLHRFSGDCCSTSVVLMFLKAFISRPILFPWRYKTTGKFVELFSERHYSLRHRQQKFHALLLWLGLDIVIGLFRDVLVIEVMPEALISRCYHVLITILQREAAFPHGVDCILHIDWMVCLNWVISLVRRSMTEQRFLCVVFGGRKMLHCGVLMDLLLGENGKTKHLWAPWVLEFFMGLLQFVPVELECGFSQWRFGDVGCEFLCCTNVSCASRKMFCSILVLVRLPQPYGKHVSLSTVSMKVVLDYFHKHVFCDFSFATPFTSRCHTMGLFCCSTLLGLERECELATGWDFLWGFMVSYSTGTTACNWSTSHAISRESKLFLLPMDPLSGDFMSEYGVVLRPKSGHKHKIKADARQYKDTKNPR
ncbi:hypothetical protein IGI04_041041 [Brassica rapa subsp. trilocularis]|uniref:Uncharacterized protein n=1 Tax=Brassica rapa subsp. trilocularis TaxID=1813537 RepID=A0ABQ7KSI6_BRACM|nr:hypothetical protein IGI04_041041 [Brassica rapa subsp. trilocularis]